MPLLSGDRTGVKQGTRPRATAKSRVSLAGSNCRCQRGADGDRGTIAPKASLDGGQHHVADTRAGDARSRHGHVRDDFEAPEAARPALDLLAEQFREARDRIEAVTDRTAAAQQEDPLARRLATIPGVGPLSSSAFSATTPDVANFRTGRDYAAWLGLTPRPHSSGGKDRLGRISKAGNRYLRRLLYLGAMMSHRVAMRSRPMANDQCKAGREAGPGLALAYAGAQTGEGGRRRTGEPHGPGDLGPDRVGRELPGRYGLNETAGVRFGIEMVRRNVRCGGRTATQHWGHPVRTYAPSSARH